MTVGALAAWGDSRDLERNDGVREKTITQKQGTSDMKKTSSIKGTADTREHKHVHTDISTAVTGEG